MIDAIGREPHFISHLAPVWLALPGRKKGGFYVPNDAMAQHALSLGIEAYIGVPRETSNHVLVASWGDYKRTVGQPVIFMEHGSGISYGEGFSSYAGGRGKDNAVLFLCPNERVAELNSEAYPNARIAVVGCPKLDGMKVRGVQARTTAISFHWPCHVVPETNWAYPEYRNYLRRIGEKSECEVLGHAHPRVWSRLGPVYKRIGIEPVRSFADVLDRSDLYVVDNSSTLYEFAAAGRPTVVMNSVRYRRHIDHGLRFWEHIPGPQVDHGSTLAWTIKRMLDGEWEEWEDARLQAVRAAYGQWGNDGRATKRAIAAIQAVA